MQNKAKGQHAVLHKRRTGFCLSSRTLESHHEGIFSQSVWTWGTIKGTSNSGRKHVGMWELFSDYRLCQSCSITHSSVVGPLLAEAPPVCDCTLVARSVHHNQTCWQFSLASPACWSDQAKTRSRWTSTSETAKTTHTTLKSSSASRPTSTTPERRWDF